MSRLHAYSVAALALPFLIISTAADAQQNRSKDQRSQAAIAARQECFREAQARFPGPAGGNISVNNQREAAYRGCVQRKGVRP